ncbi:hypothetical protein B0J14DRAFT_432565, partial [Halenospora varia]
MTETLGVAASGMAVISLAMQVAQSLKKLKDFCSLIASAPTEILLALDEIEALSLILEDIDNSMQESLFSDARTKLVLLRSYKLCRSSGETLKVLVEEMDEALQKGRKRGGLKYAMKQSVLDSVRRRLESTKGMLILANQVF